MHEPSRAMNLLHKKHCLDALNMDLHQENEKERKKKKQLTQMNACTMSVCLMKR